MKKKAKALEDAIRVEAYILSERAGHPAGMEEVFWVQAEETVYSRLTGSKPPSRKMAVKKAPKKTAVKTASSKKTPAAKVEAAPVETKPEKAKSKRGRK